jgi:hypothetical protein
MAEIKLTNVQEFAVKATLAPRIVDAAKAQGIVLSARGVHELFEAGLFTVKFSQDGAVDFEASRLLLKAQAALATKSAA